MIEKILGLIDERGMTQAEVERMCGLSSARITKWKDGTGEPTASQILRIADLLRVPVRYLIDEAMTTPTPEASEVERQVLWLARQIGLDVAVRRLAAVPEGVPETQKAPAVEEDEPRPREIRAVRSREVEGPGGTTGGADVARRVKAPKPAR